MARIQKKIGVEAKKKKKVESEQGDPRGGAEKKVSLSPKKVAKNAFREVESGKAGFFQRSGEFLREVGNELKKVVWPSKKQTMGTTAVVLVFVFVAAAFLGVFDYALSKIVQIILT